jgi:hypothetical protein
MEAEWKRNWNRKSRQIGQSLQFFQELMNSTLTLKLEFFRFVYKNVIFQYHVNSFVKCDQNVLVTF